jgi:hypothetical protein
MWNYWSSHNCCQIPRLVGFQGQSLKLPWLPVDRLTFQDGDVIKSIDGREPKDLHHAVRILSSYEGGETVNFEIMRDKRKQTITIEVPDDRRSFLVPRPAVAPTSVVIAPGLRVWREPDERT